MEGEGVTVVTFEHYIKEPNSVTINEEGKSWNNNWSISNAVHVIEDTI